MHRRDPEPKKKVTLDEKLARRGLHFTPQRQNVYAVLLEHRDHPTAEQVFIRAKQSMPEISIATVYNCLDALVKCGMVRVVNLDRNATRYCPNMDDHFHFCCHQCNQVFDIGLPKLGKDLGLPKGFRLEVMDISMRGLCPQCSGSAVGK